MRCVVDIPKQLKEMLDKGEKLDFLDAEHLLAAIKTSAVTEQDLVISYLNKLRDRVEDYMNRKWDDVSDADEMCASTLDDWKYHMAEACFDEIDDMISELQKGKENAAGN